MKNEKNAGGPAAYVMKRKTGIQFLILAVLIGVIAAATVGSAVGLHAAMDRSCLLYTSPSPRDRSLSRMPSSA